MQKNDKDQFGDDLEETTLPWQLGSFHSVHVGALTDKHRSGRIRILTARDDQLVKLCSERDPWLTEECDLENTVSINSVKRSLHRSNLFGIVAAKKPRLTKT